MKKVILIILDGWGLGDHSKADAIYNANTPFFDKCLQKYPNSTLKTSGEDVGLPDGQMGNSEVGHLNIGAGKIVYQDLVKINKAIEDKSFAKNSELLKAFNYAKKNNKSIHIMGLVSTGGIHSHQDHLYALCNLAKENGLKNIYVHAFTDGRDCDPKSGLKHIKNLLDFLNTGKGELVSIIGRYYAMDRDKRWDRIKIAYDMLVKGKGEKSKDFIQSIKNSYNNGITDEFIKPIVKVDENNNPIGRIKEGDVLICFNFRTDRCRQITIALSQKNLPEYDMHTIPLYYVTMTNYDDEFKNTHILFKKENLNNTLGEIISKNGLSQLRIAETEKYPHVTFFFSGGREEKFEGEKRIMIPSPKVATYDLKPEMSAYEVKNAVINEMNTFKEDLIILNFANPDMVGHTGVYKAIIKAVETIDKCLKEVCENAIRNGYSIIITADHGNADKTINADGTPNTAHTVNPVPFIIIDKDYTTGHCKNGRLSDIAPTILSLMNPKVFSKYIAEMEGKSLLP